MEADMHEQLVINSETPLAHQIDAACARIGISRTLIYDLLRAGELRSIKVGARTLIPESELQALIAKRMAQPQ
jgi:excisionase family DNA binding protein